MCRSLGREQSDKYLTIDAVRPLGSDKCPRTRPQNLSLTDVLNVGSALALTERIGLWDERYALMSRILCLGTAVDGSGGIRSRITAPSTSSRLLGCPVRCFLHERCVACVGSGNFQLGCLALLCRSHVPTEANVVQSGLFISYSFVLSKVEYSTDGQRMETHKEERQ